MIGNTHRSHLNIVFILALLLPILTGCWDRTEIESRANILGIAIDVVEDNEEQYESKLSHLDHTFPKPKKALIQITAQIAVPGRIPLGPESGSSGSQKPVWVLSTVGHTLDDAILNLQQEIADRLFFGHLRVIIVSDKVAKQGVGELNDYLRRNPEVRRTAWMIISNGKASKVMESSPQLERIPTLYLSAMMENAVLLGKFPSDFLGLFWSASSKLGQEPFLPVVEVKRYENTEISGLAYFHGDRMVGVLKPLEIGFFMAVKGITKGGYAAFTPVPGQKASVLVRSRSRSTQISAVMEHGRPKIKLDIHVEVDIVEKTKNTGSLNRPGILKEISAETSRHAKNTIENIIAKTQKDESDIFGFGEYIRAKLPDYWNTHIKTKENWREQFKKLEVDIHFTTTIRRVGMRLG
ncbi:Ger(x)C family spore germination protein [Brevibacillus borstelensis]|uniref:Ger(x)C family spore germination protein n=1 Tax=Brevibacillus borstelensis TaxID=45462 RepID=UPI0030BCD38C